MAVGDKYAFLQMGNSIKQVVGTAGATVTFSAGSQPAHALRIHNIAGTIGCWIGQGTQATNSATVTSAGLFIGVPGNPDAYQVIRSIGSNTAVLFVTGTTETATILMTPGEGLSS